MKPVNIVTIQVTLKNNFMIISKMKNPVLSIVWEAKLKYMGTKIIKTQIKILLQIFFFLVRNSSKIALLYDKLFILKVKQNNKYESENISYSSDI